MLGNETKPAGIKNRKLSSLFFFFFFFLYTFPTMNHVPLPGKCYTDEDSAQHKPTIIIESRVPFWNSSRVPQQCRLAGFFPLLCVNGNKLSSKCKLLCSTKEIMGKSNKFQNHVGYYFFMTFLFIQVCDEVRRRDTHTHSLGLFLDCFGLGLPRKSRDGGSLSTASSAIQQLLLLFSVVLRFTQSGSGRVSRFFFGLLPPWLI